MPVGGTVKFSGKKLPTDHYPRALLTHNHHFLQQNIVFAVIFRHHARNFEVNILIIAGYCILHQHQVQIRQNIDGRLAPRRRGGIKDELPLLAVSAMAELAGAIDDVAAFADDGGRGWARGIARGLRSGGIPDGRDGGENEAGMRAARFIMGR